MSVVTNALKEMLSTIPFSISMDGFSRFDIETIKTQSKIKLGVRVNHNPICARFHNFMSVAAPKPKQFLVWNNCQNSAGNCQIQQWYWEPNNFLIDITQLHSTIFSLAPSPLPISRPPNLMSSVRIKRTGSNPSSRPYTLPNPLPNPLPLPPTQTQLNSSPTS